MSTVRHTRQTSEAMIITLAIVSVLLFLVPAGVYAGIVLALLVLGMVLTSDAHRHEPRMVFVGSLAVLATTTALVASRTIGG